MVKRKKEFVEFTYAIPGKELYITRLSGGMAYVH